jgi:hypothetical protein
MVNPGFLASCRRAYFIRPIDAMKVLANGIKRRSHGRSVDCARGILVPSDSDYGDLVAP